MLCPPPPLPPFPASQDTPKSHVAGGYGDQALHLISAATMCCLCCADRMWAGSCWLCCLVPLTHGCWIRSWLDATTSRTMSSPTRWPRLGMCGCMQGDALVLMYCSGLLPPTGLHSGQTTHQQMLHCLLKCVC